MTEVKQLDRLTRQGVADYLGISVETFDRYRRGKGLPDKLGLPPEPDLLLCWDRAAIDRWRLGEVLMTGFRIKLTLKPGQKIEQLLGPLQANKLFTTTIYADGKNGFIVEALWPAEGNMSADDMLSLLKLSRGPDTVETPSLPLGIRACR